ncbi:hypothetical protein LTR95_001161 [Oleoguttula sp. CCFEE 5521]
MADHQTVKDLQARLKRLTFAIHGDDSAGTGLPLPTQNHGSHPAGQVKDLQRQLQSLESRSGAVNEALQLQAKYPEVLSPPTSNVTLPPAALAALVVSHARLYESLSGQLNTLQTLPVPDAAPLTALSTLQPRISKATDRQQQQAREFAELRARSAAVVEQCETNGRGCEEGERAGVSRLALLMDQPTGVIADYSRQSTPFTQQLADQHTATGTASSGTRIARGASRVER